MTTHLTDSPEGVADGPSSVPPDPPGPSLSGEPLTTTQALARGSGPRALPVVELVDAAPRVQHRPAPGPVARPVSTLVTHAAPGQSVEVFASNVPPRAERVSIFDPNYGRRAALEAPPSPAELAALTLADVPAPTLAAMQAREARSVFDPNAARERALYDGRASVPARVADPNPVRVWATPAVVPRMPASSRCSVLEERRGTPVLYPRERP